MESMTDLTRITKKFEGKDLTTIQYRGRLCWIAAEVGQLLEYSKKGSRLVDKITESWCDELVEGADYVVLQGPELADFKSILEPPPYSGVGSRSSHVMLLYESGLHFVCIKTNKPIGKKLRRYLIDEVMPQLARDGRYSPDREVTDNEVVEKEACDAILSKSPAMIREERLGRQQKARALKELAKMCRQSPRFTPEVADSYEIEALEVLSGKDLSDIKPANGGFWKGYPEIAYDLVSNLWEIGRATSQMGIRANIPGIAREIEYNDASNGTLAKTYLFSPKAVKMIQRFIGKDNRNGEHDALR